MHLPAPLAVRYYRRRDLALPWTWFSKWLPSASLPPFPLDRGWSAWRASAAKVGRGNSLHSVPSRSAMWITAGGVASGAVEVLQLDVATFEEGAECVSARAGERRLVWSQFLCRQ